MSYNINLKHLECFIKVAQLGSINKAAQALFISQPIWGKLSTTWKMKWAISCSTAATRG